MSLSELDARGLGTPAAAAKEEDPTQEVVERRNQSKYDFVKVRVWVEDHVYVLSRYLVSRALVGTKVRIGGWTPWKPRCLTSGWKRAAADPVQGRRPDLARPQAGVHNMSKA